MKNRLSGTPFIIAMTVLLGMFLLGTGVALAADPPVTDVQVVSLTVLPDEDGDVMVAAQFATSQGQPVAGQRVSFFQESGFMGGQRQLSSLSDAFLGNATTDESGTARFHYTPVQEGTQRVVAIVKDAEGVTAAEATVIFDVTLAGGIHAADAEPSVLPRLREWTPIVVGAVVLMFWAAMGFVLMRSSRGILAMAHSGGMMPHSGGMTPHRSPLGVGVSSRFRRR